MIDDEDEIVDDEQEAMDQQKLEALALSLLASRDKAVAHRAASGVERMWRAAEMLHDGPDDDPMNDMIDYASGRASVQTKNEANRSKVWINITRGRCETAAGRFVEILMPVADRNWQLQVTPVPELSSALKDKRPAMQQTGPVMHDTGEQATMGDVAQHVQDEAEAKMLLMQDEIDDQLTECRYNSQCRKGIEDEAVKLGTCVMKGPSPIKDVKKSWQEIPEGGSTAQVMKMIESIVPSSKQVSCWNIYPSEDCKDDIQMASGIWERGEMLPKQIRKLFGVPGYNENMLNEILMEDPIRTRVTQDRDNRWKTQQDTVGRGLAYETWEGTVDLGRDEIEALGCSCEDVAGETLSASVLFINDRPVKAELNPLDTGDMPYDFFQWCKVSDSVWGIGIPTQISWLQRIICGAWRGMMDNAGDSSGANIIVGKGVTPADGRWELTGKKIWRMLEDDTGVRDAFAQFQVANNQAALEKIIDLALKFVDLETATPTIFNGEMQQLPETLGATNIIVDSSNIAFRLRAQRWDDLVTSRHLTRYYDYNMMYSKKEEIKGDYKVDPIGVKSLFAKDQKIQLLTRAFQMKGDPDIEQGTDWGKATRLWYDLQGLDIAKPDEQIEKDREAARQQPPPQAPQIEAAKIRTESDLEKAKMNQQSDMEELKLKYQMAKEDRDHQLRIEEMKTQQLMLKLSADQNISIDSIKAALASDAMKLQTQKELSAINGRAKQVSTPETEPAGKAPRGEAYQK